MQSYKDNFKNRSFLISFLSSILILALSVIVQSFATKYATSSSSGSVADIILSNTRVYDVDGIFVWGSVILTLFTLFVCLYHIKSFPFVVKSVALLTLIRSLFMSLTHISPFPGHVTISSAFAQEEIFRGIFTGNDLFFSGHTAVPFLLALIFWDNKILRVIFLGWSALFATVVLLGHIHYSIDVLSAFFITFSIYHIACLLLKKDKAYFDGVSNSK